MREALTDTMSTKGRRRLRVCVQGPSAFKSEVNMCSSARNGKLMGIAICVQRQLLSIKMLRNVNHNECYIVIG